MNVARQQDAELASWVRSNALRLLGYLQISAAQFATQRDYTEMESNMALSADLRSLMGADAVSAALAASTRGPAATLRSATAV
jgi:hypothetical protein